MTILEGFWPSAIESKAETGRKSAGKMATGQLSLSKLNQMKVSDEQGGWILDLSGKELKRLPPAVTSLDSIHTLDISDNPELSRLPADLSSLTQLQRLAAAHCGFSKFPRGICGLRSLVSLNLSLNNMIRYPAALPELCHLERLELVNCSLTEVPVCVTSLRALRRLDLRCNRLSHRSFPAKFDDLDLCELDVSGNELVTVPACILNMPSLRALRMSHCALTRLPDSIGRLNHLTELRLSNNNLASVPKQLFDLSPLEVLHLDHNNLARLPHDLSNLKGLLTNKGNGLLLAGNPLVDPPKEVCDKGIKAIMEYLKTKT